MRFVVSIATAVLLTITLDADGQKKTFVEPILYGNVFSACGANVSCTRTADFSVNSIPTDCCVLEVMNGGGNKKRAVSSYEVYLNSVRVIPAQSSDFSHAAVKLENHNTLRMMLQGKESTAIAVMLTFGSAQKE